MAVVARMTRHSYQRDFDDLGLPSMMADLKANLDFVRPGMDSKLDILSASSYPHQSRSRGSKSVSSDPSLGYVVQGESEEDNNAPPNKKAKTASNKKQRGRPRLEPKDETAADRRRTQIRLAQRAYRNRKENTISALKVRVTDLQRSIEQMHKSFSLLHDNLLDSARFTSTPQVFVDQVEKTMEEFDQLARAAADDWDQDEEADNIARLKEDKTTPPGSSKISEDEQDSEMQFQMSPGEENFMEQDSADQMQLALQDSSMQVAPSQIAQLQSTLVNAVESGTWMNPSVDRPLNSDGQYTYSFQETTFARRLHRQALERAFRFLSNPELDPTYAARTFRFTFTFSNRKRILARLQEILKRKAGESLENWAVPYFPIGGAGMHFPRRDNKGNPVYPPNMLSPTTAFGPNLPFYAETPRPEETTEKVLEAIGFGGEWFDSHDVEEFLKTKGIYLDAQSSFVSVDSSLLNSHTPSRPNHQSNIEQQLVVDGSSLSITEGLGDTFGGSNFLSQTDDSPEAGWMWNIAEPGAFISSGGFGAGYAVSSTLTFDVEKFLNRCCEKSACLGRAPGFRRSDVENALQAALQEAL